MGNLASLCGSFLRRFDVNNAGQVVEPDGFPPSHNPALMHVLIPHEMQRVHAIGSVAKLDALGQPIDNWMYELPPMSIVGVMQSVYHVPGVSRHDGFPYGLKALGRVNAVQIMKREGRLVSDKYAIVP
jgi:hypothetical protein